MALLEVSRVPNNGETLIITEEVLVAGKTDNCRLLIGETFKLNERKPIQVKGKGKCPSFGLTNTKFL